MNMTPEEIAVSALARLNHSLDAAPLQHHSISGKVTTSKCATQVTMDTQINVDMQPEADRKRGRRAKKALVFPVDPITIQSISKRCGFVNHSYRDFSRVPPEIDWQPPKTIDDMTFAEKIHDILGNSEDYGKIVAWMPHGRSFRVVIPVAFERKICQKYFGHKRYSSFLRQLNNHGFKHITKGIDRNCYYHECMLRGMPHLCKYMPTPKDARRTIPDPDNEPDFYHISKVHPLPDMTGEVGMPSDSPISVKKEAEDMNNNKMQSRLASEVPGFLDQLPPAKRTARSFLLPTLSSARPHTLSFPSVAEIPSTAAALPFGQTLHIPEVIHHQYAVAPPMTNDSLLRARALLCAFQVQNQSLQLTSQVEGNSSFSTQNPTAIPSGIEEFLRLQLLQGKL